MNAKKLAQHRRHLEELRAELLAAGPARIEPNRRDLATTGVADEDEQALNEMLQTLSSERNKARAATLALIAKALAKLDGDPEMYGLCEECEEDIDARRLELSPFAPLCAECQAAHDPRRGRTRRSLTDFGQ